MNSPSLQDLCQAGQDALVAMRYLEAEATLLRAEAAALAAGDFDTLSRLYMPLQEARRQRRQLCGEGQVRLDLVPAGPGDPIDVDRLVDECPQGQFLVAGWASLAPGLRMRELARERGLYVESFLAAAYPVAGGGRVVAIVPTADVGLPPASPGESIDHLFPRLPPHTIVIPVDALPSGPRPGTTATFAETMALWERLHLPFLAAADHTLDPRQRIAAYRRAIEVDYACELAHQKLSDTARRLVHAARS